jgi:nucleotide-binding universal stress UspA family protein
MYRTILVPTDGSDGAAVALDHAVDLATQYGAAIHVLFVAQEDLGQFGLVQKRRPDDPHSEMVQEHETGPSGLINKMDDFRGAVVMHGESVVDRIAEQIEADIPGETAVLHGTPHERILDYADENDIDLIVMGTHGRSGLDRYLLGSVAEKVLRAADAPVLTVRFED